MFSHLKASIACATVIAVASPAFAQNWVNFAQDQTRMISDPSIGLSDNQEKDYGLGDFDKDGRVDVVVVRKLPFSNAGARRNVLFMNEGLEHGHSINGVLVDRTVQYATATDGLGQGMLDLTDDRDVAVVDVNGDDWLDLVTATTYGGTSPKYITHPRIYINLGEVDGVWQGFRYEQNRIPNLGYAPNFCGVGAGDVTGNKLPDLYFVSYNSSNEDVLLISDGNGFYTNQTSSRLTSSMINSSFGSAAHIYDMNGDGKLDIIKSENGPVDIHINGGSGFFTQMATGFGSATYHVTVHDLNNDGRMDMVTSDDGIDRYHLNTTPAGSTGSPTFTTKFFPSSSSGFNGESRAEDLNNDGFRDVIITDVDVDAPGCSRTTGIYRNLGNLPNVTLTSQATGIAASNLTGVHDVAIIDLNGDGWKDLILGRCTGTQIWMNQPPSGLVFTYPQGLPSYVPVNRLHTFQVKVTAVGATTPMEASAVLHYAFEDDTEYTAAPMTYLGDHLYSATLPAMECAQISRFYVSALSSQSLTFRDPAGAPAAFYNAVSASGTEVTLEERFELAVDQWTVTNHASLTGGGWAHAEPNATIHFSNLAAPGEDGGAGDDVMCFVTENGPPGASPNQHDVDGGPTMLTSPIINLADTDATISYDRWFYSSPSNDSLTTEVSNNGGASWVLVHQTSGTGSEWEPTNFRVGQFVTPTNQVRVRFATSDAGNNSVTEAGIDNFRVQELLCEEPGLPCPADLNTTGATDVDDLLMLLAAWGDCGKECPADIAPAGPPIGDGVVNVDDLLVLLAAWGPCE